MIAEHYQYPTDVGNAGSRPEIIQIAESIPSRSLGESHNIQQFTLSKSVSLAESDVPSIARSFATERSSSVNTSRASDIPRLRLLVDDDDGTLILDIRPLFECAFWFLNCQYSSEDEDEWRTHCLFHLRGHPPPKSISCPLCTFTFSSEDPNLAWNVRSDHVAGHHRSAQSVVHARPDFQLFQHLWRKRIVTDAELKASKDQPLPSASSRSLYRYLGS